MTNHPNRGQRGSASNPMPAAIIAAREEAGLTQTAAADLIYSGLRTWQQWEAGDRRMHPALWDLFRIRVRAADVEGVRLGDDKLAIQAITHDRPDNGPSKQGEKQMQNGVMYLPSGWMRDCADEAQARDAFEHAPQGDGDTAILSINGEQIAERAPD